MNIKTEFIDFIQSLQLEICDILETIDGKAYFRQDIWQHPEGGGGRTHVIEDGNVFEKGGVNTSVIHAKIPDLLAHKKKLSGGYFTAAGISIVIHPLNPFVPTIHANFRYFELYDKKGNVNDCWFGGGADLTPYYLDLCDGKHFHQVFKEACDPFGHDLYPLLKKKCDEYFVNKHRNNEMRGIGGIFYDDLSPDGGKDLSELFAFSRSGANAFLRAYLPLIIKNKDTPYTDVHREWQAYRRGRYVEFNLIHDKGTLFGLQTNGRIESILMSLPPVARWKYNFHPLPGSPEEKMETLFKPLDWINMSV